MYNRPEQILEQYELEVKSISRGRDSYQCDTEQGPKILREYRGSKERAGFLADMLDHLSGQGRTVETVMRTKEGEPFSVNEEETEVHPNTVDIVMTNAAGQRMEIRGES